MEGRSTSSASVGRAEGGAAHAATAHARASTAGDGDVLGEGRFEIVRELGQGGMGTVYEAVDRTTGQSVALKTFRRVSSDAVFRLKREFRSLADLEHPNLIQLHELFADGDDVFFTMELVSGQEFVRYVAVPQLDDPAEHTAPTLQAGQRPLACDEDRLRRVLPQLAAGIAAIHAAGKLHRDIKPSNVLVTDEGVVKVLDFGLAIDIDGQTSDSMLGHAVGTPSYMSPEQAASDPTLGPASDWYAFGTVLYEALTGVLPFSGPPLQVMLDKTRLTPPPPRQLVPEVPRDLDGLAESLLSPAPEARLRGATVLTQLGVTVDVPNFATGTTHTGSQLAPYCGRQGELDALRDRFELTRDLRRPGLAVVAGESGIGKSAFIGEFLARLRADHPDLVVLRGRCYESETVPHNALDPIIDQLSRHWRRLDKELAGQLLPREPHLLPVLFPVLGRVPTVARQRRLPVPEDAQQRRDAAYAALRETLARLAHQAPLVIVIDDMQWSDDDSLLLLSDLLHPKDGVPALLLLGTRPAGLDDGTRLSAAVDNAGPIAEVLPLGPLPKDECSLLARHQLGSSADPSLVDAVVEEAAGNPFFVTELARYVAEVGHDALADGLPRIEHLIDSRVRALPDGARALLEVLAVAGEPVPRDVASAAADLEGQAFTAATRRLRGAALARSGGTSTEALECYHDRVRHAVVRALAAERHVEHHRVLANTLLAMQPSSDERIANHYRGCGEHTLAAEHFERAAKKSLNELEFVRASSQLALALELGAFDGRRRFELLVELGDTLGKAGRHGDAAARFAQAVQGAEHDHEVIDLRRRIASSWLALGDIETGLAAARDAAEAAGMNVPGKRRAFLEVVWATFRYRAGLRRRSRRRLLTSGARERAAAETCLSLSQGLAWLDPVRAAAFGVRLLKRAEGLGSADLLAYAHGQEAIGTAFWAHPAALEHALAMTRKTRSGDARVNAIAEMHCAYAESVSLFLEELNLVEALAALDRADKAKLEAGLGDSPGTEALLFWRMTLYYHLGRWRALDELVSTLLNSTARSGHRFVEVAARTVGANRHLVRDDPAHAQDDLRRGLALWPPRDSHYTTLHYYADWVARYTLQYVGNFAEVHVSWARVVRDTATSGLNSIPNIRHSVRAFHAIATVAANAPGSERLAHRTQRALLRARRNKKFAHHFRELTLAVLADRTRRVEEAAGHYRKLLDLCAAHMYRPPAQLRLGMLIGGTEGEELKTEARLALRREGVLQPDRFAMALIGHPGWQI